MKVLTLSTIPAPYRIAVFKGLSSVYETTVFFERIKDGERNKDWFEKRADGCDYYLLCEEDGRQAYEKSLKKINEYDLVLCYEPFTKTARKLQRLCMRKRVPYIINADGALGINRNPIKKIVKSFYIKRAKKCFSGCKRAEEYFLYYGAKREQIARHNFTSLYSREVLNEPINIEEKSRLKVQLGIKNVLTFISVGQFIHRKGFDILLNSWKKMRDERCQLIIIGGGNLRSQYEEMIAQYEISNVIIRDFIPHNQIIEYFKACDYFVMPTREDIWGLVVNEAMAVGMPVISSDHCTAANELVVHGMNGFIYPVEDTEQLYNTLNMLLKGSSQYRKLSQNALNTVSGFTYENIIECHIKEINSVLSNRKNKS